MYRGIIFLSYATFARVTLAPCGTPIFQEKITMPLSEREYQPTAGGGTAASMPAMNQSGAQAVPLLPATQVFPLTTEGQILSPLNSALALATVLPGNIWPYEQAVFDLWASGRITTTATGTVTAKVYAGTSTTIANNTLLGSSGAINQNTATSPWFAHARLIFDSVSGTLCGDIEFYINRTRVAQVTLSNFPANINIINQIIAGFSLTFQFSAAGTGLNTVNVQRFSVG
jgi:hypothetical protein